MVVVIGHHIEAGDCCMFEYDSWFFKSHNLCDNSYIWQYFVNIIMFRVIILYFRIKYSRFQYFMSFCIVVGKSFLVLHISWVVSCQHMLGMGVEVTDGLTVKAVTWFAIVFELCSTYHVGQVPHSSRQLRGYNQDVHEPKNKLIKRQYLWSILYV